MTQENNKIRLLAGLVFMLAFMSFSVAKASAQDEPRRYEIGEIKVGDRVEADPNAMQWWYKCTVTKINFMVSNPNGIDTFSIKCDAAKGQAPRTYNVIADTAHVKPSAAMTEDKNATTGDKDETPDKTEPPRKETGGAKTKTAGKAVLAAGGPSEEQIKNAILEWLEKQDKQWDRNSKTTIDWDSAVRVAAGVRKTVRDLGTKTFYPVKVDYTVTTEHPTRYDVYHWKDGVYGFYKNEFGEWKFILSEQPTSTRDAEKSVDKDN
ncbi:MAG TPA: hypothetical protein VIL74_23965 [Pyrinomonadaceae bacterium]|jgi:hypothetical protein